MTENDLSGMAIVLVVDPAGKKTQHVIVTDTHGQVLPYEGKTRRAAFRKVFDRDATDDELVHQTFPLQMKIATAA